MLAEEKQDQMPLTGFKVLTFDYYGTLIDWERGIGEALKPLLDRSGRSLARDQVLEAHARHEADLEAKIPDLRNFGYMLRELGKDGVQKGDILHIADSPFHDLAPANRIGLASAWIRRQNGSKGAGAPFPSGPRPKCDFRFPSLVHMTRAHQHFLRAV
jgi:FMN phosphatase YigB (HAD superfamily)